jgi:hypothetical protein
VCSEVYEWIWVYAAVEPATGDCYCLLMPGVDKDCLQAFLDRFARYAGGERVGLVMDNSGSHRSKLVSWPAQVAPMPLPPYSPELNPAEAIFRHLRARLSNRIFDGLPELEESITDSLREFWQAPALLTSLTGYPWWLRATDQMAKRSP